MSVLPGRGRRGLSGQGGCGTGRTSSVVETDGQGIRQGRQGRPDDRRDPYRQGYELRHRVERRRQLQHRRPLRRRDADGLLHRLRTAGDQREQPHEDRHHAARRQQGARRGRRRGLQRPEKGDDHRFDRHDHDQRPQTVPHGQHQQRAGRTYAGSAGEPVLRRRAGQRRRTAQHPRYLDLRTVGRHHDRRRYRARHELSGSRRDRDLHDPQRRIGDGTLRYPRRQRRDRRDDQARPQGRETDRRLQGLGGHQRTDPLPRLPRIGRLRDALQRGDAQRQPLARGRLAFALHADGDRQLPPRQRRQLRRAGLQLGLFRLCVPALGIAGLQPLGTRRHGPRPLLHPGKLLQAGRQLQALQLRQRQQFPAL